MKNYYYYVSAANWWRKKIEESGVGNENTLDLFEKDLSFKINAIVSLNGSMVISTFGGPSKLLDEVAFFSGLNPRIPSGYEMRIQFNNVCVYNSEGNLVANF